MVLLVLLCSAIYKLTKFVMRAGPLLHITGRDVGALTNGGEQCDQNWRNFAVLAKIQ